jgi:hypothetical protein
MPRDEADLTNTFILGQKDLSCCDYLKSCHHLQNSYHNHPISLYSLEVALNSEDEASSHPVYDAAVNVVWQTYPLLQVVNLINTTQIRSAKANDCACHPGNSETTVADVTEFCCMQQGEEWPGSVQQASSTLI